MLEPVRSRGEKPQLPNQPNQRSSSVINTRMNDHPDDGGEQFVLHFEEERTEKSEHRNRTEQKTRRRLHGAHTTPSQPLIFPPAPGLPPVVTVTRAELRLAN